MNGFFSLFYPILAVEFWGIDPLLSLYAIVAFIIIGVGLVSMILFTRAKFVSSELCKIDVNEDPDMTKKVPGGQTVLSALTHEGIAVPCPCGGKATCLQCRVQIVEGADLSLEIDKATFTKKELKDGWRLSCQAKLKHDIHISIPESYLEIKELIAKVKSNENVATFIKELVVEIPEEITYQPGDYLQFHVPPFKTNTNEWKDQIDPVYNEDWDKFEMFGVDIDFSSLPIGPGEVIRAYSMASYPAEKSTLKFNVRIATPPFEKGKMSKKIPWGICSTYTFMLKPGDEVKLSGPFGESHMVHDERELVFLIGGAGSSFGRSHIMHLFHTLNTKRKVTLWYGARSLKENIYEDDYRALDKKHDNFTYHLVLSEPTQEDLEKGWPKDDPLKTAYLFKAFELGQLKKMEYPEDCLYYVCGPPMHNICVMKLLDDYGVSRESIVLDDFGS